MSQSKMFLKEYLEKYMKFENLFHFSSDHCTSRTIILIFEKNKNISQFLSQPSLLIRRILSLSQDFFYTIQN